MHRINSLDASLINALLGTKFDNKIGLNNLPPPNYDTFPTRTAPSMSEEEYVKAIAEQARKDASQGKYGGTVGCKSLSKSYVSVVSPDRRGIISKTSRSLSNKGRITFAEFKSSNNEVIAHYSQNNGWTSIMTKSEAMREYIFWSIYREAWNEVYNDKRGVTSISSVSTFDVTV